MNIQSLFLTDEESRQLALMLTRKHASAAAQRYFEVTIKKDHAAVYATVILRNQSGTFYYPVEGRLAHDDHEMKAREAALFLIDFIDLYFEDYLREGEVFLPIDWSDFENEGTVFQMRGQILNLEAEKMADELLSKAGFDLPDLH